MNPAQTDSATTLSLESLSLEACEKQLLIDQCVLSCIGHHHARNFMRYCLGSKISKSDQLNLLKRILRPYILKTEMISPDLLKALTSDDALFFSLICHLLCKTIKYDIAQITQFDDQLFGSRKTHIMWLKENCSTEYFHLIGHELYQISETPSPFEPMNANKARTLLDLFQ